MSGNGYQGKNSIPHLTVREPAWPEECPHWWVKIPPAGANAQGIKILVRRQRAEGPSVSPGGSRPATDWRGFVKKTSASRFCFHIQILSVLYNLD